MGFFSSSQNNVRKPTLRFIAGCSPNTPRPSRFPSKQYVRGSGAVTWGGNSMEGWLKKGGQGTHALELGGLAVDFTQSDKDADVRGMLASM